MGDRGKIPVVNKYPPDVVTAPLCRSVRAFFGDDRLRRCVTNVLKLGPASAEMSGAKLAVLARIVQHNVYACV